MIECCGKQLTTKYCPDCGTHNTSRPPLESLLDHIDSRIKSLKKTLDKRGTVWDRTILLKWTLWRNALAILLAESGQIVPMETVG